MITYPVGIYLVKVNNLNTRTRCEICSKLTIKISEWRHCLKKAQNSVFYLFWKFCHFFPKRQCKMKVLLILDFPLQTHLCQNYFTELFYLLNYYLNYSWPIRLQDFWKCNTFKKNWGIRLIFCFQIEIRISYELVLLPKVPKIICLQYLCNISRRRWRMNMIFCMKISINVFYNLVVSFLLVIARHAQSTQNSKFVVLLQCVKKEGRGEADFLHADKHQTILQVDTINLGGSGQACPNYPNYFC